jgi:hypothetical protein
MSDKRGRKGDKSNYWRDRKTPNWTYPLFLSCLSEIAKALQEKTKCETY